LILAYQRISPRCILGVILAGAALSFGIELAQLYIISRDSEMTDVYANALGTLFGAAAGVVLQGVLRTPSALGEKTRPFVFVLLACWVGYRLSPYLPEFSPHNYAAAVRALFSGSFAAADLYRYTVTCCALCLMGAAALGKNGANFKIPGLILMVLLARTLIAGTVLSPAESAGTALGLLLWWSVLSRLRARAVLIAILFAGAVGLQALEPFTFRLPARRFGIIPFHAFLNAPIDSALRNFLEKTFLYGTLVWLMTRAGVTWIAATVSGGALVLGLRLAQVYLPGRSAEITDLVLLLLMAGVMRLMTEDRSVPHTE
jgi:VanZ family protein